MRTTKGIPWRMGRWGLVAGAVLVLEAGGAWAATGTCTNPDDCKIGSDRAASIVVFPKIVVDTSNGIDTVVQLANVSERRTIDVLCFYIDGVDCSPRNFPLRLTKRQPISWKASEGLPFLPCDPVALQQDPNRVCQRDDQGNLIFNSGSVPPVEDDPFTGELKCFQVDEEGNPVDFNELIGEATIIHTNFSGLDARKYNAIGIQGIPGRQNSDKVLCLGGDATADCPTGAEYAGCPQTLVMDHYFDSAPATTSDGPVVSDLTLVPCAEELETGTEPIPQLTTVQLLVFNEFEQRFSTSFRTGCFDERRLSDIDTREGDADDSYSIFNFAVQGTVTGQTRIRAVGTPTEARGLLGLLEETHVCGTGPGDQCTDAINLHHQGRRPVPDIIRLP